MKKTYQMKYLVQLESPDIIIYRFKFLHCIVSSLKMANRVYIGRIPYRVHERDIERFFRGIGRIRDIMLKSGYCFVVRIMKFFVLN